jgi:uncharacterized protein
MAAQQPCHYCGCRPAQAGQNYLGIDFEWDPAKETANILKHGVSFAEASTVFGDPLSLTIEDQRHLSDETRFVILGKAITGRLLVVVHPDRGSNVQIISAPTATRRESMNHERGKESPGGV